MSNVFDFVVVYYWHLIICLYLLLVLTQDDPQGRILRLLISLDVMLFAIFTFGGSRRNETASSAAWELYRDGKWQGKLFKPVIDWVFSPFQKDHCWQAWYIEQHTNKK